MTGPTKQEIFGCIGLKCADPKCPLHNGSGIEYLPALQDELERKQRESMNATEKARQWLCNGGGGFEGGEDGIRACTMPAESAIEWMDEYGDYRARAAELAAYEECCKAVEGETLPKITYKSDRDYNIAIAEAVRAIRSLPRFQELQKSKS
jgi:hypothetical protein